MGLPMFGTSTAANTQEIYTVSLLAALSARSFFHAYRAECVLIGVHANSSKTIKRMNQSHSSARLPDNELICSESAIRI